MSDASNIHHLFEPDSELIKAHLNRLFRRVPDDYPGGIIEIAWSDLKGQVSQANSFPATAEGIEAATELAIKHNLTGRNIYVGVNPRKPGTPPFGRASAGDVEIAFFQFADCDGEPGIERLRSCPLPYTFAVTTGRTPQARVHAYWELEEPTRNLQAWSACQSGIRDHFGSDAVVDPPRIMRLAGTVSYPPEHKTRRGYVVEKVTLRTLYPGLDEGELVEREPLSWETINQVYPSNSPSIPQAAEPNTEQPRGAGIENLGRKTDREWISAILSKTSGGWRDATRDYVGSLINRGLSDALILALAPALTMPGYTVGQTHEDLSRLIIDTRKHWGIANQEESFDEYGQSEPKPEIADLLTPLGILDPTKRKPRDWLVKHRLMRKHLTMTAAAPGVGKSTLAIEEAVSLASGRDFLNFGIATQHRVAIVNNEETRDELERRIEATCKQFEIDPASIAENLFLFSGVDAQKLVIARSDRLGNVTVDLAQRQLKQLVSNLKLDLVILDPCVQMHESDESSNAQMSRVLVAAREIGSGEHAAAIHVIHHTRKPPAGNYHQAGDMNASRGASAMAGEAHFFFTLTDMSPEDGEKLNVPEHDRKNFIRLDDAKRKMAPANGAQWFERFGVLMPYGLVGEEIGVLIPRDLEDVKVPVSVSNANVLLMRIDEAWNQHNPYSEAPNSKRYAVRMMTREANLTQQAAKALLNEWIKNAMVESVIYDTVSKSRGLRVLKWPG